MKKNISVFWNRYFHSIYYLCKPQDFVLTFFFPDIFMFWSFFFSFFASMKLSSSSSWNNPWISSLGPHFLHDVWFAFSSTSNRKNRFFLQWFFSAGRIWFFSFFFLLQLFCVCRVEQKENNRAWQEINELQIMYHLQSLNSADNSSANTVIQCAKNERTTTMEIWNEFASFH